MSRLPAQKLAFPHRLDSFRKSRRAAIQPPHGVGPSTWAMPLVEFTAIVFALMVLTLQLHTAAETRYQPRLSTPTSCRFVDPRVDGLQRARPQTVCLDDFHAQLQFSQSRHFVWHGQKKSRPEAALHFKADVR
jgi:hypothetical protein